MDRFTALLDANIIYSAGLRDVFLRLTDRGLYRARWSAMIHEEWMRNVRKDRPDISFHKLERTREIMDRHFPDALAAGFEPLIHFYPDAVIGVIRYHRAALRRYPRSRKEHLEAYERMGMTKFSSAIQAYSDSI